MKGKNGGIAPRYKHFPNFFLQQPHRKLDRYEIGVWILLVIGIDEKRQRVYFHFHFRHHFHHSIESVLIMILIAFCW